ncbi:transposase [Staphylococcus aureus]|uniref:transposase n=1 Tax=Staphylococcus aureus TaxID=1280 RepID=UPI000695F24A|nr:transposase [Staphylococcus aureus]
MYKNYNMTQLTLPIETSVRIPQNDISRYVNEIVETIPDSEFDEFRHHRGATSYHPKMMLKIILYAYTQSVFSGRRIEKLLHDSIRMMWLAQNQTPSYKTINRFRVNPNNHDATFMRMKEDHMKNGQLKPGYNLQIATNSQFVLSYDLFQNPTDTRTLIPFLTMIQNTFGYLPEYIVADAGYGSEQNYMAIIDDFNKTPLITYGMFIKDKTRKFKSDIFNTQNWKYDELNDEFICPNNKRIGFKRYANRNDRYGFKRDFKLYECDDCSACSLRQQCMKPNSKSNKKIMKNYNWEYFKAQINQKLSEPETKKIYSQRKIDVESVFGFMKAILGFTRMSVRGINKVKRELGFVLMALNIRKIAAQRAVHYKINIKKADFHQIINRNQLFYIA